MFLWEEGDLNTEQIESILESESVFLVACPGSGKTRTLTYKIALELSKLTDDRKRIVAITYTHRAADEIFERIENLGVDTSKLWIGTIHSFCLEWILKPYGIYHESLRYGFRIINSHDTENQITELCRLYEESNITYYDCNHHYTTTGRVLSCNNEKKPHVEHVLDQYFSNLLSNNQVDFEQILLFSYELISQNLAISKILSSIFSYILIDEYQDTKEIQYKIFSFIFNSGRGNVRTFIVGDPNQAIYGSLGGYAITANEFRAISNLTIIEKELSLNYRSSGRVINYFSNFNVYNTNIFPAGSLCDFSSSVTFDKHVSKENLVTKLAELIRFNIETRNISPNELCIIAPWWMHLASMTRSLVSLITRI